MTKRILPTPEELRELLTYEPETGTLLWKERPISMFAVGRYSRDATGRAWNTRYAGKPALNSIDTDGYCIGTLSGGRISAHRVAWALYYGSWCESEIDHINGCKTDNRIANLREAAREENRRNIGIQTNNTSGVKGVSFSKDSGKWRARVMVNGVSKHVGYYDTIEDATLARRAAADKYHGEFARHE